MAILIALLFIIFNVFVDCKVYDRCELARELKHVHKFPDQQIATWVCIAKHESIFNTSAVNLGSGDHGLFQISNLFWCSPPGSGFACNAPCSAFEDDDITDDVACIRRIFKEHSVISGNGFNAWAVYPLYCQHDVSKYVEDCFDKEINNSISQGSTTTLLPEDEDDVYEFPPLPAPPKNTKLAKEESVYDFPSLPTTPRSNGRSSERILSSGKPSKLRLQNQISTVRKVVTTAKSFPTFQLFTTPKPSSPIAVRSYTIANSVTTVKPFKSPKLSTTYKPFKPYTVLKQDVRPKGNKVVALKSSSVKTSSVQPYSVRSNVYSISKPSVFQKSSTLKPLTFIFENVHSDHKREQTFHGSDNSEYSFLWKSNGFRLVKN